MTPIPLTSPTGAVYAYACGRCHHVGISGSRLWREAVDGPDEQLADGSREDAERCCTCLDCKAPLDSELLYCDECKRAIAWRLLWIDVARFAGLGLSLDRLDAWFAASHEDDA